MSNSTPPPPIEGYTIYDPIDPFENNAGPFYWRLLNDGSHHFVLRTEERHANAHGLIHGGLMMTMADLTMAVTAKGDPDDVYVTVSFNSEFVASGHAGDLVEAVDEELPLFDLVNPRDQICERRLSGPNWANDPKR